MKAKYLGCLIFFLFLSIVEYYGQTFSKVTSSLNPIVTDINRCGGGSWVDIDNDGDLDLYISNGNLTSQNNDLYINDSFGNFTKTIIGTIVSEGGSSIGSAWGDFDNDNFLDCYATNRNYFGNFLYKGDGSTNPSKLSTSPTSADTMNSNSSSWIDIDNDGDLDLYVVNFMESDFLYLNQGGSSFSFTANQNNAIQLDTNSFSIPGIWGDYNNDRKIDLFVGNSGSQNDKLYTNNGTLNFSSLVISDGKATLGGSWGDYDNDGDLDLYIANYLGQANILYTNSGAPLYLLNPVSSSPVLVSGNNVGSAWGDIDNDGDQDLFVCDDGGNNHLYLNSGFPTYTFTPVTTGAIVSDGGNSFGCSLADYDNDGSLDAFVANQQDQTNFLYHNIGNSNNWITIKCKGVQSNKSAIGAQVLVKALVSGNAIWQMQEVLPQSGYNSQNLWLHFGFADAASIDTMIVKWPSGITDTCFNIPVNNFYTATEGSCLVGVGGNSIKQENNLKPVIFPNPVDNTSQLLYYLKQNAFVEIKLINELGEEISTLFKGKQIRGKQTILIDMAYLHSGVYYCAISTDSGNAKIKLIVIN